MTEIQDLKAIAERCKGHQPLRFIQSYGALYIRNDNGIVFDVHQNRSFPDFMSQNKDYADLVLAANPAAVLELIAEIERLQHFEVAYKEFSDKTDWVQETAHGSELGMHRADVLRKRCDDFASHLQAQADQLKKLIAENDALRKDAERLDRLEEECEAYGTDIHEGNRWVVDGPFATVRDAIDAAMSSGGDHD
ncbi:hypothetical protein [Pseudomonas sp. SLFW]|uniref:hypothetical protein n=1 Tax=Pseudomonas sp. SLFW TaxID=2683259 RepID=UPI0014127B2F|nr:hypothetical protein [Pseudomonas sp. SLFW]NBB11800.1 hypothetical protein [Pseudomonas sp. SLFW]